MNEIDITGPMPDRNTDLIAYEAYIHARALARSWREKRGERTPSGPASFGGTLHQPNRLNLDEVA